jgi:peptidoglycan hydrolase-like protein with peptidoglycan-binding domain
VTGWFRLAATFILFFATMAGTAAASKGHAGGAGLGGSGGSTSTGTATGTTTTSATATSTSTTTSTTPTSTTALPEGSANYTSSSSSIVRVLGSRTLSLGLQGSDVMILQRDLTALGYKIPATGRFNALTQLKLKAFQQRYHLTVDGVAGPTTITALKRLLSSKLHITESALAAKELAEGVAVTATSNTQPLPTGDTGLASGGAGLGTTTGTTGTTTTGTTDSTEQDATLIDGLAVAAPGTPPAIVKMLDAANQIAFDPYIYGGGHASFTAAGYDCSGSVSYVLHAGNLLATPLDSEQFLQYGLAGTGNWITIYTNGPTHAYMEIAGLWFDTAAQSALNGNDRWSPTRIAEPGYGKFTPRHPANW